MSRIRPVHFFLLAAWALPAAAAPAPEKKAHTVPGWGTVVDPDGDCTVKWEKGAVTITVPGTHHDLTHTDQYDKVNAPRILGRVQGNFLLQVTARAFPVPEKN